MTRRRVPIAGQEAAALRGMRRMVSRGERPAVRVRARPDGSWSVTETPWLTLGAVERREVTTAARHALAVWLDCDPSVFDVEVVD